MRAMIRSILRMASFLACRLMHFVFPTDMEYSERVNAVVPTEYPVRGTRSASGNVKNASTR